MMHAGHNMAPELRTKLGSAASENTTPSLEVAISSGRSPLDIALQGPAVSFPTSPDSDLSCASLAFALALAPVPPPAVQVTTTPLPEAVTVTPSATGRGGNFDIDDPQRPVDSGSGTSR
jgi:hypothetical protein